MTHPPRPATAAPKRYYLDNCANTPVAAEVIRAMTAPLSQAGNPSSIHREGQHAARLVAHARKQLADSIGAKPAEIVFCSSGTEANNLAIGGLISAAIRKNARAKVVTSNVEHASIRTRLAWEKRLHGAALEIVEVAVDNNGIISSAELAAHLDDSTTLVALLLVNNETGVVQDIDALKQLKLSQPNVPWLLDMVQAQGKLDWDVRLQPFELLSFSAHKIYGPMGIGALFVRGGTELDPLIVGGAQEKYRRAGTENLAGIVGFGEAIQIMPTPAETAAHLAALEAEFLRILAHEGTEYQINGPATHHPAAAARRLPGFLNLSFSGISDRGDIQIALDLAGIALSSTSACHSGVSEDSHVLKAMGLAGERLSGAVRVLFSRYHTIEDARACGTIMAQTVRRMRRAGAVV